MEKDSLESAFSILEMYGVPKSRAQTVSNGIMVLVSRMEKEISSLKYEIQHLQNTSSNSDYEKLETGTSIKYDRFQPCKHEGCLSHMSHSCEGCGRIGGDGIIYRPSAGS